MPFFAVEMPSLSLSLIKAALERAGFGCDVKYVNVEFGKRVGLDLYRWIAHNSPTYLLFGDLVFAPALHDSPISIGRVRALVAPKGTLGVRPFRDDIVDAYPQLVEAARDLLNDTLLDIDWSRYGLVGFATTFQVAPALAMARLLKTSLASPPPVILGGSNCDGSMGEQLHRSFPWIDYVCRGEGEGLTVELAEHLSGGPTPLGRISGLVWRDHGETRCSGSKADLSSLASSSPNSRVFVRQPPTASTDNELDLLPVPAYDDWVDTVRGLVDDEQRQLPIMTARGCWYGEKQHCRFCGLNREMIGFRRKSPERALEEFRRLMNYRGKLVISVDQILDHRYFKTLLPELTRLKHGKEIRWEVKANLTYEQVRLLRASGIVWIQAGIESLSTPVLRLMRKGVTAFQNVRLLRYAAEFGIGTAWNILYGFPGENPQDYREMADLLPGLFHLHPPPAECGRLRMDRFSPFYLNRDAEGLTDVKPRAVYDAIYPFDRDTVDRMAYHFEYGYRSHPDPNSYILPVAAALERWHGEVGRAAFLSVRRDDAVHLLDTRGVATERRVTLQGADLEVFTACQHGATLNAIARGLHRDPDEIQPILDSFVDRRWVVHLDGRFLSLAVPADTYAPRHLPVSLVENSLLERYCAQMLRTRPGLSSDLTPPSFDVLGATLGGRQAGRVSRGAGGTR